MSIIITGGTSFIGVEIIKRYLEEYEHDVIAIIRPKSSNLHRLPNSSKLRIIELDMRDIKQLLEYPDINADIFYHLAWEGVRWPYREDEVLQHRNYECAIEAMQVAIKLGCKTFIGSGSQAEYDVCDGKIEETYRVCPKTAYGKYKLQTYNVLKNMALEYNVRFIWSRIFSVYGENDYEGTLIMSALKKMLNDEPIALTSCEQYWDFLHVRDVADAMYLLAIKECEEGIYNIASGNSQKLKDFVVKIKEIANSNSELKFGEIVHENTEIISFRPIVQKLKDKSGWEPRVTFTQGISEILNTMK